MFLPQKTLTKTITWPNQIVNLARDAMTDRPTHRGTLRSLDVPEAKPAWDIIMYPMYIVTQETTTYTEDRTKMNQ